MKKLAIALILLCAPWGNAIGADVTLSDTLWLRKGTHLNNALAMWDTLFVNIYRGDVVVERRPMNDADSTGRWSGFYVPTYKGNFVAEYNAVYSGDTIVEEMYFTVFDPADFKYGGGDSVRADLVAYDSILLETAAACGAGTGNDTIDIIVLDDDSTAVEGVDMCVYNPTKTAKAYPNVDTDVNGYKQVSLDPGSYPVWCQRLGIIQSEWDTLVVPSGGGRDTLWVVNLTGPTPPSENLVTIIGYNRDLGYGKNDRLAVVFKPQYSSLEDTATGVFVNIKEIVAYSDTGYFTINVIPSTDLIATEADVIIDSIMYDVNILWNYNITHEYRDILVPDSTGAIHLKDLLR